MLSFEMPKAMRQMNYFHDEDEEKEYLIFTSSNKPRVAYFFDLNGKINDSISLKPIAEAIKAPYTSFFISKEKIAAFTRTHAYLMSSNGTIIYSANYDSLLSEKYPNDSYRMHKPKFHILNDTLRFYFQLAWKKSDEFSDAFESLMDEDFPVFLRKVKEEYIRTPFLIEVTLGESPKMRSLFDEFNSIFIDKDEFVTQYYGNHINFFDQKITISNRFTDQVWSYDLGSGKSSTISIQPATTELEHILVNLNDNRSLTQQYVFKDYIKELIYYNPYIISTHFISDEKLHVVYIKHPFNDEEGKKAELDAFYGGKSILIYDENWKLIDEYSFENKEFSTQLVLTQNSILVNTTNKNKASYNPTIYTFRKYSFDD